MNRLATLAATLRRGEPITVAGALFDMDGTLVNSIPAVEGAWKIWASEFGVAVPGPAMHGKTARAVVVDAGLSVEHYEGAELRLGEIEANLGQKLDSLPGARQLLESLPHDRWGLVTSAARVVAVARLAATDLPLPSFRVTGDDVAHGKPAPDPFLLGLETLRERGYTGVVLAFEDTAAGVASAADAGCLVIGVLGTTPRELLETRAHLVLDSLDVLEVENDAEELRIRIR